MFLVHLGVHKLHSSLPLQTYGGFVAFALGISLIAIVVSIARIRRELGLIKKKPDQTSDEDSVDKIKTFRTASYNQSMSYSSSSIAAPKSSEQEEGHQMSICAAKAIKELAQANESGDEVMSSEGYEEFLKFINTTGGEAPQELKPDDAQGESPVEEEKKIDTTQGESPVEVAEKFLDEEKEPKKAQRRRSSFSDFVIGLNKDDGKDEEEKKLEFAEAFTNLLLLLFEDFPVSRDFSLLCLFLSYYTYTDTYTACSSYYRWQS